MKKQKNLATVYQNKSDEEKGAIDGTIRLTILLSLSQARKDHVREFTINLT